MCYIAESCQTGFNVFETNIKIGYDDEWDDEYCIPTQKKQVAHFDSNGEIIFFSVSEDEQAQILSFARREVMCQG